jgi:hypothetical protein
MRSMGRVHSMVELKIAGALLQSGVCLLLAIRILRVAVPARHTPEVLLGTCILALGFVGAMLFAIASGTETSAPILSRSFAALAILISDAAVLVLYEFGRRVFRPASKIGFGLLLALVAVKIASVIGVGATSKFVVSDLGGIWGGLGILSSQAIFGLLAVDSFGYHLTVSRQARLGLGDPVTANRFFLFSVICGAAAIAGITPLLTSAIGAGAHHSPIAVPVVFLMQVVGSIALWLAFAPPRAFTEHVKARAAASAL